MIHLRPELIADRPNEKLVSDLKALAQEIIRDIDRDQDCTLLLEKITELTGLHYLDEGYFRSLHSHSSVQDFANVASLPRAKRVSDLTREELEEIVERAMNVTNWDAEYYMELFDKNVPMPSASNLIFHPPEEYSGDIADYNPSPEEIVALAMAENNVIQL